MLRNVSRLSSRALHHVAKQPVHLVVSVAGEEAEAGEVVGEEHLELRGLEKLQGLRARQEHRTYLAAAVVAGEAGSRHTWQCRGPCREGEAAAEGEEGAERYRSRISRSRRLWGGTRRLRS